MSNRTDQDAPRQVGDRLAPATTPDKQTIREDRNEADSAHTADRPPTPEEEAAAERSADSAGDGVAEHYQEMLETGAEQQGEGKPGL